MAIEQGEFSATLAAAAGTDEVLRRELLTAFTESAGILVDLMHRSRCDANWILAAQRLRGLAASFHMDRLMALADEALDGAPDDPVILRQLDAFLSELDGISA